MQLNEEVEMLDDCGVNQPGHRAKFKHYLKSERAAAISVGRERVVAGC